MVMFNSYVSLPEGKNYDCPVRYVNITEDNMIITEENMIWFMDMLFFFVYST